MVTKKKATKKKASSAKTKNGGKKDVGAFVDFIHSDPKMRATVKKGWDAVISAGKKKGYSFTKQQLHDHLKKRYGVVSTPDGDEPDTCVCI